MTEEVNLTGGQKVRVALGALRLGAFDQVWPVITSGKGILQDGRRVSLETVVEPIALVPALQAGKAEQIEIALVVLKRPGTSEDGYVLFTGDVRAFNRAW